MNSLLLLLILVAFSAASDNTSGISLSLLRAHRDGKLVSFTFRLTNSSSDTIYVERGGWSGDAIHSLKIEQLMNRKWLLVGPVTDVPSSELVEIKPSEAVESTVSLSDPYLSPSRKRSFDINGLLRGSLRYFTSRDDWECFRKDPTVRKYTVIESNSVNLSSP